MDAGIAETAAPTTLDDLFAKELWTQQEVQALYQRIYASPMGVEKFAALAGRMLAENAAPSGAAAVKAGIAQYMLGRFEDAGVKRPPLRRSATRSVRTWKDARAAILATVSSGRDFGDFGATTHRVFRAAAFNFPGKELSGDRPAVRFLEFSKLLPPLLETN